MKLKLNQNSSIIIFPIFPFNFTYTTSNRKEKLTSSKILYFLFPKYSKEKKRLLNKNNKN